jgi:hypothetical protein
MSPRKPIKVARTRPHSSLKTRSISAPPPGAPRSRRPSAQRGSVRDLQGRIQIVGLEQVVAAEDLLGRREGTVGAQRLPALDPDRGRGIGRLQLVAADDARQLGDRVVLAQHRFLLVLGELLELTHRVARVDQQHVLHRSLLNLVRGGRHSTTQPRDEREARKRTPESEAGE